MSNSDFITLSPHAKDITGQKFGRLIALGPAGKNKKGEMIWECQCDCGNTHQAVLSSLTSKRTQSCGCLHREIVTKNAKIHGMSRDKTYRNWAGMIQRCTNPKNPSFKNYGGRNIKICDKWLRFEGFFADMGKRPANLSIERIDNNGDYSPDNCIWGTREQQNNNARSNQNLTYNGETKTLSQWADCKGISSSTLSSRIHRHKWTINEALTQPVKPHRKRNDLITHNGTTRTLAQWAEYLHISYDTLYARIVRRKWPINRALFQPLLIYRSRGKTPRSIA